MVNGSMGEPTDDNVTDMSEVKGEREFVGKRGPQRRAEAMLREEKVPTEQKGEDAKTGKSVRWRDEDAQMVVVVKKMMMMG